MTAKKKELSWKDIAKEFHDELYAMKVESASMTPFEAIVRNLPKLNAEERRQLAAML